MKSLSLRVASVSSLAHESSLSSSSSSSLLLSPSSSEELSSSRFWSSYSSPFEAFYFLSCSDLGGPILNFLNTFVCSFLILINYFSCSMRFLPKVSITPSFFWTMFSNFSFIESVGILRVKNKVRYDHSI
jgi:hypothetical protein